MTRFEHRLPWALLLALGVGLLLTREGGGQEAPAPETRWEYSLLTWEPSDTVTALREASGATDLTSAESIAQSLSREGGDLRDQPRILSAIEHRLEERLSEAGAAGWEAYWVRNNAVIVGGSNLPVPTVFLKRPAR